jgi:Sec-independent protein translocase protein TatA
MSTDPKKLDPVASSLISAITRQRDAASNAAAEWESEATLLRHNVRVLEGHLQASQEEVKSLNEKLSRQDSDRVVEGAPGVIEG